MAVIRIKNMVCPRCIMAVENLLREEGFEVEKVGLGYAFIGTPPADPAHLDKRLRELGFSLLQDEQSVLIEKIKNVVLRYVREEEWSKLKLSAVLEDETGTRYNRLSTLFSSGEGMSIERYAVLQRLEWAKELITYEDKTLSEIAFICGYSSAQHLSARFKRETGMSPSEFRRRQMPVRKPLDFLGKDR